MFPSFAHRFATDARGGAAAHTGTPPAVEPVERMQQGTGLEEFENCEILTGQSGGISIDEDLRKQVCLFSDNRLLVSKQAVNTLPVRGFISRMRRIGRDVHVIQVNPLVIHQVYQAFDSMAVDKRDSESQMQKDAAEIFTKAVVARASDIHIRVSKKDGTQIQLRIHGELEMLENYPYAYGIQFCTTIYQAMTNVSDSTFDQTRRQDARISDRSKIPSGLDGIRIGTSPIADGVIMVLRLLYNDAAKDNNLENLGFTHSHSAAISLMRKLPNGFNLICGPTGSGKSTTLQRVLGAIHAETPGKHIITVEDPPEYPIEGANQTPVTNCDTEEERSAAFRLAIKAAMRLDPDVIMIGEIRDQPSAQLAVEASMTGHQVWSTLHANGAFSGFDRLINLGVPRDLIFDPTILTSVVCQRLTKALCPSCKVKIVDAIENGLVERSVMDRLMGVINIDSACVKGNGCDHPGCRGGVVGRTVVSEIIVTDQTIMGLLRENRKIEAIGYWRNQQGGIPIVEDAIRKVNMGLIDPIAAELVVGPLVMASILADHRLEHEEVMRASQ